LKPTVVTCSLYEHALPICLSIASCIDDHVVFRKRSWLKISPAVLISAWDFNLSMK